MGGESSNRVRAQRQNGSGAGLFIQHHPLRVGRLVSGPARHVVKDKEDRHERGEGKDENDQNHSQHRAPPVYPSELTSGALRPRSLSGSGSA